MKHIEDYFSGAGGKKIYYQGWLPKSKPKAILMVVHGLAEHSGRYMNVVNHFVPLGYAVYAPDQIGHGKSEGPRTFVKNFDDFITTLEIFFDLIQKEQPGKPVFIVGHSMGGLISSYYLLDHQEQLAGAVISGGMAQVPEYVTPVTVAASKVLSVLAPRLGMVGVTAEHISQDKAVVDAYVNDPLVYTGKSTARLGAEMLKAMARVENEAAKIKLPILIVHGGEDKLVSPGDGQLLYDTVSSEDKTIKIYDGYYHEVFNEPGRDAVFADIEAWLKKHLK